MRIALAIVFSIAGGLKPPVIHEQFTPLPCPTHPATTIALEGCGEQAILRSDRAIDADVKVIFTHLIPSARPGFVRGEIAWLSYRRASCTAEASVYAGGTEEPVLFASCEASRNRTHLQDLNELKKTL